MNKDIDKLKMMRDSFRKCADIIDKLIILDKDLFAKDYEEQVENLVGKMIVEGIKIKALSEKLNSPI